MLYIYLPGFSLKNLDEADHICSAIKAKAVNLYQHSWRHWANPEIKWDADEEVKIILEKISEFNESEYTIIAKSLGTFVAMKVIAYSGEKVKKIILLGIPINDIDRPEQEIYSKVLNISKVSITVIHNNKDPHGTLKQVEDVLYGARYELKVKEAEGHSYDYPDDIIGNLGI